MHLPLARSGEGVDFVKEEHASTELLAAAKEGSELLLALAIPVRYHTQWARAHV